MSVEVCLVEGPLPAASPWGIPGAGAVLCFDGIVRPHEGDTPIIALYYDVYEPMTTRELRHLAERIAGAHGLLALRVEHSQGEVRVGECSFRLRVASRHRQAAIAAMSEFIDVMKRDIPIWKRPRIAADAEAAR